MNPKLVMQAYFFLKNADKSKVRELETLSSEGVEPQVSPKGQISVQAFMAFNILIQAGKFLLGEKNPLLENYFAFAEQPPLDSSSRFKLEGLTDHFLCTVERAEKGPFDRAFDILLSAFLVRYYNQVIVPLDALRNQSLME